jgi:hypothetical protein
MGDVGAAEAPARRAALVGGLLGADSDRHGDVAVLPDLHVGPLEGLHGERAAAVAREPLLLGQDEAGRADQREVLGAHGRQGRDVAALLGLGPAAAQIADLGVDAARGHAATVDL